MIGMEFVDGGVVKNLISNAGNSYFTSGNVGIGTNNPQVELEVFGSGEMIRSTVPDATSNFMSFYDATGRKGYLGYGGTTDDMTLSNQRNGYFRILVNEGEGFRITNTGNVGLGVSAPTEKLQVNGTVRATGFNLGGTDLNIPIGDGQQWYNDGTITTGAAYGNTTGRPKQVMVSFNGSGSKTVGFSTNGSTWVDTLDLNTDTDDSDVNASFIVPAGHYWRVVGSWTSSRRNVLR